MNDKALAVRQQPNLAPQSYKEMREFAAEVSKTDFCPKAFQGKPGDVMVAIQFGSEVGLAPLQSLQNLAVINGKPSIYGDGLLALAQSHPACEYINETFDEKTMTARCESKRRGAQPKVTTFTQADAEKAGLWTKDIWRKYPKRMLQMRARGFNLRDNFADALKGLISREEAQDYPIDITAGTRVIEPDPEPVVEDGFSEDDLEVIEETMEGAAAVGTLAEVWKDSSKAWFAIATESQKKRLIAFKDELKESRPEVPPPEEKPDPKKKPGRPKKQAESTGGESPPNSPDPEAPHPTMSMAGAQLMKELEDASSLSQFWEVNKERVDSLPSQEEADAIRQRSDKLEDREKGL